MSVPTDMVAMSGPNHQPSSNVHERDDCHYQSTHGMHGVSYYKALDGESHLAKLLIMEFEAEI